MPKQRCLPHLPVKIILCKCQKKKLFSFDLCTIFVIVGHQLLFHEMGQELLRNIFTETSVRPYVGVEKFVFLSIWRDSDLRNYPIPLKFDTNIYVLCEIMVHIAQIACVQRHTKVSQYIEDYRGKFFKISFDIVYFA